MTPEGGGGGGGGGEGGRNWSSEKDEDNEIGKKDEIARQEKKGKEGNGKEDKGRG